MNKMNWKWALVCAAALICATVLLDTVAWAGKPLPPTPPPPPIHYQINYFTAPGDGHFGQVNAMNNSGMMVGTYHPATHTGYGYGFIYNPNVDPGHAFDLNDLVQIPGEVPGDPIWYINNALSINDCEGIYDCGVILVNVQKILHPYNTDPDYEQRGLLIDTRAKPFPTSLATRWTATWIPVVPSPWNSAETPKVCYGRSINNNGDLLGGFFDGTQYGAFVYNTGLYDTPATEPDVLPFPVLNGSVRLNDPIPGDPLWLVGNLGDANSTAFRYTVETRVLEGFPLLDGGIRDINGDGEFCGRMRVPKQKGSQFVERPYRFNPNSQVSPTLLGSESEHSGLIGWDINNTSDVGACGFGGMYLFHSTKGIFNLDNLVIGTPDQVNSFVLGFGWGGAWLTERDAMGGTTGFPSIGSSYESLGCLLVPVK